MLHVKNVIKSDDCLSADYFYRDTNDVGHITLNLNTGEVIEKRLNKEDETYEGGSVGKVVRFLRKMIKTNRYPESADYMWY